jgi:CheY-like chemotaxis protein/HPt (histidine-containing phosphotransfer) domain-containing protein
MAEDDPANAKTLQAMLGQVGFSVVTARNGEEAVARAATGSFDVIFMDGQMPIMDGLDATRIIRDDEARRGIHRPIIGVTANSMDEYRDRCIDAGMDDVVHKPVTMAGLLRMLARWLPEAPVPPIKPSVPAMPSLPLTSVERTGASTPKDAKVIDWSQLDSLRSVDPHRGNGVVGRAIGLYIDSAPKLIEEIRGFRSGKDIKDVRRAAHFLRSSSMSLGATMVAGLSKAIESAAAQGDFEIIDATLSALEAEYWRAASELRKAVA